VAIQKSIPYFLTFVFTVVSSCHCDDYTNADGDQVMGIDGNARSGGHPL